MRSFFGKHSDSIFQLIGAVLIAGSAFAAGWLTATEQSKGEEQAIRLREPGEIFGEEFVQNLSRESGKQIAGAEDGGEETKKSSEVSASSDRPTPERVTAEVDKAEESSEAEGLLVGSVNSDKFHFPDCPGAKRIKEENKVWFDSVEEAEDSGYVPSKCALEKL